MELAICGGDRQAQQHLEELLRLWLGDIQGQAQLCLFPGPQELLPQYTPGRFAFLFLDVQAGGLDCARQLRAAGEGCQIAFLSEGPQEALACYEVHPAGYLLKPVERKPLFDLLRWHRALFLPAMERLTVRSARVERQMLVAEILYITVQGRTSILCLRGEQVRTNTSLGQLAQQLAPASFFRCHREYLVNPAHILDLQGNRLVLDSGQEILVSENNLRQAQALLEARRAAGRS